MTSEQHACEEMRQSLLCEALAYIPKFREWGVPIPDGGSSYLVLTYCPWCGVRLPSSLRDEWFTQLSAIGVGQPFDNVPEEFTDDRWWRR